jgi:hypothetical protein
LTVPKGIKIVLYIFLPLFLVIGVAYGLAKIGVLPVRSLAKRSPALGSALKMVGLDSPQLPARQVPATPAADSPQEHEKKALAAQRAQLEKERAEFEAQKATPAKQARDRADDPNAPADPKELARLASVYEQMPPEAVTKIFAKLPDPQVIGLLRRMDEKQVGQILAIVPPDRAAHITLSLAHPAAPLASN